MSGKIPCAIAVGRASDITEVVALASRYTRLDMPLLGAAEAGLVADALAKARIAAILNPYTNLPLSFDDPAATLHNAERLSKAGVLVAFAAGAEEYHPLLSTLAQAAGDAVANGLPWIAG